MNHRKNRNLSCLFVSALLFVINACWITSIYFTSDEIEKHGIAPYFGILTIFGILSVSYGYMIIFFVRANANLKNDLIDRFKYVQESINTFSDIELVIIYENKIRLDQSQRETVLNELLQRGLITQNRIDSGKIFITDGRMVYGGRDPITVKLSDYFLFFIPPLGPMEPRLIWLKDVKHGLLQKRRSYESFGVKSDVIELQHQRKTFTDRICVIPASIQKWLGVMSQAEIEITDNRKAK